MMTGSQLQPLIFAKSIPGVRGLDLPPSGVPTAEPAALLPGVRLRREPPHLPELAEPQVVRHYTLLSQLNHAVDTGFYPLGSCTMKYNPKMNDELAILPGFSDLHPYQAEDEVQGILRLMHELEGALLEVTCMHRATLQPAAGAQGELAGILMIQAAGIPSSSPTPPTVPIWQPRPWPATGSWRFPVPLGA